MLTEDVGSIALMCLAILGILMPCILIACFLALRVGIKRDSVQKNQLQHGRSEYMAQGMHRENQIDPVMRGAIDQTRYGSSDFIEHGFDESPKSAPAGCRTTCATSRPYSQ